MNKQRIVNLVLYGLITELLACVLLLLWNFYSYYCCDFLFLYQSKNDGVSLAKKEGEG